MRHLEHIYQQWQQGNSNYIIRYMDFVQIASKILNRPAEESLRILEQTIWFRK